MTIKAFIPFKASKKAKKQKRVKKIKKTKKIQVDEFNVWMNNEISTFSDDKNVQKCLIELFGCEAPLQALTHIGIKGIKYNLPKKQVIYAFTKVFMLYYHGEIGYDKPVLNEDNQVIAVIVPYTKKSSVLHSDGSIVYTIESNPESSSTFYKPAFTLTVGRDGYATFRLVPLPHLD